MVLFLQFFAHALCHTTQNSDDEAASVLAQTVQGFEPEDNLLFGVVAHGTGVQEYGICLVQGIAQLIASHVHYGGYDLAVCHIHLAAISLYK